MVAFRGEAAAALPSHDAADGSFVHRRNRHYERHVATGDAQQYCPSIVRHFNVLLKSRLWYAALSVTVCL